MNDRVSEHMCKPAETTYCCTLSATTLHVRNFSCQLHQNVHGSRTYWGSLWPVHARDPYPPNIGPKLRVNYNYR